MQQTTTYRTVVLGAAAIHIWTDVDGVLSADPRMVPDAPVIDSL